MRSINVSKRLRVVFILLVFCIICCDFAFAGERMYNFKSKGTVKDLQILMGLRDQLDSRIKDTKRNNIHFTMGEFYFKERVFRESKMAFRYLVAQDTAGISTLIANVYLYKYAMSEKQREEAEVIKKEIFKKQFVLLFDEFKTLNYKSLFDNEYEVRYYVDKIEIFLNGTPFEEITP